MSFSAGKKKTSIFWSFLFGSGGAICFLQTHSNQVESFSTRLSIWLGCVLFFCLVVGIPSQMQTYESISNEESILNVTEGEARGGKFSIYWI